MDINVIDEDNGSQDIKVNIETLRGELLKKKNEDAAIFSAED